MVARWWPSSPTRPASRSSSAPFRDTVGVASVNAPANTVISGDAVAIGAIVGLLDAAGIAHRPLKVSHAFHSPLMEPVVDELAAVASSMSFREPAVPFVSTVTGEVETAAFAKPEYWVDHVLATVRFADAAAILFSAGIDQFLEIGPQPTLLGAIGRIGAAPAALHPSLRTDRNDDQQMADALGRLWAAGCEPDWEAVHGGGLAKVELPTYAFQRERHWVDLHPAGGRASRQPRLHPLLHRRLRSPALAGTAYESSLGVEDPAYLADHRVFEVPVMPATGYLELVVAAARDRFPDRPVSLEQVALAEMLVLQEGVERQVHVVLGEPVEQRASFDVYSLVTEDVWRRHASGFVNLDPVPATVDGLDRDATRGEADGAAEAKACYGRLLDRGLDYQGAFRAVQEVVGGDGSAVGRVALPADAALDAADYTVHPALLDGCLQLLEAAIADDGTDDGGVFVPVGIGSYQAFAPAGAEVWARASVVTPAAGDGATARVEVFTADGEPVAVLHGIELYRVDQSAVWRQLAQVTEDRYEGWQYDVSWTVQPAPLGVRHTDGSWLVLAGDERLGRAVAGELRTRGHEAVVARRGAAVVSAGADDWEADLGTAAGVAGLLDAIGRPEQGWTGVVLAAADADPSWAAGGDGPLRDLLATVQGLLRGGDQLSGDGGRLWVLTRRAQSVHHQADPVALAHSSLWGMANALTLEEPSLPIACVDLSVEDAAEGAMVVDELVGDSDEDRVAFRGGHRLGARLSHQTRDGLLEVPPGSYRLAVRERGTLDGLVLEAAEPPMPGAGEAVVAVRATGLNFRDVLNVLGMYPGPAGPVGTECAGVVVAVGDDVTDVAVGDEVIALVEGGFARHVVAPAHLVFRLPAGLDFAAGASIPIAFLTAQLGLRELAGMGKGDTVLVHAAAGGVGLAAVQLARRAGATVIGTAGSAEKRAFLRSIGVAHVFDSRSLDFAPQVMDVTGGRGVDIALNSLADLFIGATMDVVAEGGAFLEIGKRDVLTPEQAAERRPDVRYHLYDLSDVIVGQPERLRSMMAELLGHIEARELMALPRRCFGVDDVPRRRFRHMAMARQVGKVVVTQAGGTEAGVAPGRTVSSDATYLITGGLGGLGLEAARTLVDQGARHLALLAAPAPRARRRTRRSMVCGPPGPRSWCCRRTSAGATRWHGRWPSVREAMPRLRGIIHAAGVLDDVLVRQAEWSQFETVLGAKAAGAWHLHELTAADRLDFFVLYSSTASLLGAAGQANYAAANAVPRRPGPPSPCARSPGHERQLGRLVDGRHGRPVGRRQPAPHRTSRRAPDRPRGRRGTAPRAADVVIRSGRRGPDQLGAGRRGIG